MTTSDIDRLKEDCQRLIERQQQHMQLLLSKQTLSHSVSEQIVNQAILLEVARFTLSMLETEDLNCHLLNWCHVKHYAESSDPNLVKS